MSSLLQDLRFTIRSLRRRPLFAAVAILTMALGIGATTAIYTVVDGVLLRPLPYRDSGRLVEIREIFYAWKGNAVFGKMWDRISLGYDEFETLRDRAKSFTSVGIWASGGLTISEPRTEREELQGWRVSPSLLGVLGESVARGRNFNPGEDVVGGPHLALIGYEYWQRKYSGSDAAIGKIIHAEEGDFEVVGVLPRGLSLELRSKPADVWILGGQDKSERGYNNRSYSAIARLAPGVSIARAESEAKALLADSTASQGKKGVRLADWHVEQTADVRAPLFALLGASGLLLLIACINVAMLLLGEAISRGQEIAARVALGASRGRIVRQLLTESIVLSLAGTAAGTAIGWGATRGLVAIAPADIPGLAGVGIDVRVLAFAATVSLATGVLFGLAPAVSLSRLSAWTVLRADATQIVAGRGRFQRSLIALQLALSFLLLVGAGLFGRSLENLSQVSPGFRPDSMLVINFRLPDAMYRDSIQARETYRQVANRLEAIPGVTAVTATSLAPFGGGSSSSSNEIEGHPLPPGTRGHSAQQRIVLPGYFKTMGIPLIAGRYFSDNDRSGAEPVVIISESMAKRDWPGESALGKRVKNQEVWRTVVGIVGDVKYRGLSLDDEATEYAPVWQRAQWGLWYIVRSRVSPATEVAPVKAAILELLPSAIIRRVELMPTLVEKSYASERFRTMLASLFGVMASVLAAIGLYGVTSRAVSQRRREVAIRVALGASTGSVVRLIVRATLAGVFVGIASGAVIALLTTHYAAAMLYGVDPRDPLTFGVIAIGLIVVGASASWIPARRAARVQPATVLRGD